MRKFAEQKQDELPSFTQHVFYFHPIIMPHKCHHVCPYVGVGLTSLYVVLTTAPNSACLRLLLQHAAPPERGCPLSPYGNSRPSQPHSSLCHPGRFWATLGTDFRVNLTQTLGLGSEPNLPSVGVVGVQSQDSDAPDL